jgi:uncharacterized protein (DUF1778 family)
MTGHWPYVLPARRKLEMAEAARKPGAGRLAPGGAAPGKTAGGRARAERLEARLTADQKSLVEHAAALQGRTVTDFVLASVQDAARRVIEEHRRLDLSRRDSEAFVRALLNPPPVNDRLRETVRRYRRLTGA